MIKGNSASLRKIIDSISATRGSLLSFGSEMEVLAKWYFGPHCIVESHSETKFNYDEKQDFKSLPTWDAFYDVLSNRCQFLESHGKKAEISEKFKSAKAKPNFKRPSNTFVQSNSKCSYCSSSEHGLNSCTSFSSHPVSERFNFIKRNCIKCLNKGHMVSNCPSKSHCKVCKSAHHTVLPFYKVPENLNPTITHDIIQNPPNSSSVSNSVQVENNRSTTCVTRALKRSLIPTAVVLIKDSCGIFQPVRALLDSCSEINFILEETAKKLKLGFHPYTQEISGICEVRTRIKSCVDATLKSRFNSFEWSSTFAVTKSISSHQPGEYIETSHWEILNSLQLTDPLFYKPQRIELLIGTEVFFNLLVDGQISLGDSGPTLKNTLLGWIAGGKFTTKFPVAPMICNLAIETAEENFLKLEKFNLHRCNFKLRRFELYPFDPDLCWFYLHRCDFDLRR